MVHLVGLKSTVRKKKFYFDPVDASRIREDSIWSSTKDLKITIDVDEFNELFVENQSNTKVPRFDFKSHNACTFTVLFVLDYNFEEAGNIIGLDCGWNNYAARWEAFTEWQHCHGKN